MSKNFDKCHFDMNVIYCLWYFLIPNILGESSESETKLIGNNNGSPVPPGYHSYLVLFIKKNDFDGDYEKPRVANQIGEDFSLRSRFICSGTILTRNWVLTRAYPIAYYPLGSYLLVTASSLSLHMDMENMHTHEIDFFLIHPDHQPSEIKTDIALARTTQKLNFTFETRNINLGFPGERTPLANCKLVLWSFYQKERDLSLTRSEINIKLNSQLCTKVEEESFICLSNEKNEFQPCGINSGVPIVCDSVLVGIYIGNFEGTACTGILSKRYFAVRLDKSHIQNWIDYVVSPMAEVEDESIKGVSLKMCTSNSGKVGYSKVWLFVIPIYSLK